jgi:hypothetical protein
MNLDFGSESVLQAITFSIVPVVVLLIILFRQKEKHASPTEDVNLGRLKNLMDYVARNLRSAEWPLKDPAPALALYNVMRTLEAVHRDLVEAKAAGSGGLAEILPQLERLVKEVVDKQRSELELDYEEIA